MVKVLKLRTLLQTNDKDVKVGRSKRERLAIALAGAPIFQPTHQSVWREVSQSILPLSKIAKIPFVSKNYYQFGRAFIGLWMIWMEKCAVSFERSCQHRWSFHLGNTAAQPLTRVHLNYAGTPLSIVIEKQFYELLQTITPHHYDTSRLWYAKLIDGMIVPIDWVNRWINFDLSKSFLLNHGQISQELE